MVGFCSIGLLLSTATCKARIQFSGENPSRKQVIGERSVSEVCLRTVGALAWLGWLPHFSWSYYVSTFNSVYLSLTTSAFGETKRHSVLPAAAPIVMVIWNSPPLLSQSLVGLL
ncbi:hypothetical protein V6N13_144742 [Hibiscus sabdariffa]